MYGLQACQAVADRRRDDVVRAYFAEATAPIFSDLMRHMASLKLPYRIVEKEELGKVTQSEHHEGACLVVKPRRPMDLASCLRRVPRGAHDVLVALDQPGNPHNIGAALRVCAHFGVRAVLLEGKDSASFGSAARTAVGAAEMVDLVSCPDLLSAVPILQRNGYRILPTSSHGGKNLFRFRLPRRFVLVLGSETHGVRPELMDAGDPIIRIPGTGAVESLNMSCAASILLAEWWKQSGPRMA